MNPQENQETPSWIAKGQNVINNGNIADGPNSTATDTMEGVIGGGKEQDATDNTREEGPGVSEEAQDTNLNVKDDSPSKTNSKSASPLSSAFASPTRSVHHESVEKSVGHATNNSTGPVKRLFGETYSQGAAAATSGSSSDSPPTIDEAEKHVQASENKSAEETEELSSTKEDMEVDEINTGSLSKNPRRLSKRQRTSASNRYSPGEGGGLASKKPKAANNNGSGGTAGTGNVSKDAAALKTQPNNVAAPIVSSTTERAGIHHGGKGDGKTDIDEKTSRRGKGGNNGTNQNAAPHEWSEPLYRWVDEGVGNDVTPSSVEHQGVEIDFTNSKTANWTPPPPFVVRPGDVVLMSSGGVPWNDAKQQNDAHKHHKNQAKREVVPIYNDPASREAGLGALDPFIGYVERLWEEVEDPSKKGLDKKGPGLPRKKKGKNGSKAAKSSRMMIRTRWFFKKENVEGLKGNFVVEGGANGGDSKEEIMATMASQNLVLTDQSDDNVISTILGKIKVVKRKPLDQSSEDVEMNNPKGVFVCRYDLSFCPVKPSGKGVMMVKLSPCADDKDNDVSFQAITENGTSRSESKDVDSSDPTSTSTDDDVCTSTRDAKQGGNNYALSSLQLSPGRLVSGGATIVGKIKIGPDHQAVIPAQLDLARKTSFRGLANPPSQRIPTMVWDPATDEDGAVDEFLEEASSLLCNHITKVLGLEPFHHVNYIESPDAKAEAEKPREINTDRLLTELHECRGNVRKAIKKISGNPEKYMTIWTTKDKEQFDTGYRTYRESIRMIANSLGASKTCKDTVDYQYRFKIVENFRRFRMKKREKAEEIMASVEDRMLNEKAKAEAKSQEAIETDVSSSEEEEGKVSVIINGKVGSTLTAVPATHVGPVNNRVRTWFRTGGGGDGAVGATQQRRNHACDLLSQVRETVGNDAYATLAKSLIACNSSQAAINSLSEVKTAATDIMKGHPDLLERFISFLPEEVRSV
mmetsp:Transcript_36999/g.67892  ORF Transcript_36999/g.67892 Transcript_36999/m.67892 type:complete len:977 (-) Transcript_36999:188-3118(-)